MNKAKYSMAHALLLLTPVAITISLLIASCDVSLDQVCLVGSVYAGDLDSSLPQASGLVTANMDPQLTQNQVWYGCGQAICASSLSSAKTAFAAAAGVATNDPRLFVVSLGNTGKTIQAAEPGAVAQWNAAGMPCIRSTGPTDGGTPVDAGSWVDLGGECSPTGQPLVCCGGLMCDVLVSPATCCLPFGAECESDAECCSNGLCESNGFAETCCGDFSAFCDLNGDTCCGEYDCLPDAPDSPLGRCQ